MFKFFSWIIGIAIVAFSLYILFMVYYTYSDGNRAGHLIKFSHKGFVFKTYEGELNLGGVNNSNGGLINNMWEFSVVDSSVADSLSKLEGHDISVHYTEKLKALPWRGESKYIVDKIVEVR